MTWADNTTVSYETEADKKALLTGMQGVPSSELDGATAAMLLGINAQEIGGNGAQAVAPEVDLAAGLNQTLDAFDAAGDSVQTDGYQLGATLFNQPASREWIYCPAGVSKSADATDDKDDENDVAQIESRPPNLTSDTMLSSMTARKGKKGPGKMETKKSFANVDALAEYLIKAEGQGDDDQETEQETETPAAPAKQEGDDDADQNDAVEAEAPKANPNATTKTEAVKEKNEVEKSLRGLSTLNTYLSKADGLPTADADEFAKKKSKTQGASADGGDLEGEGKQDGEHKAGKAVTENCDTGKPTKLSTIDDEIEAQFKDGEPKKFPVEKSLRPQDAHQQLSKAMAQRAAMQRHQQDRAQYQRTLDDAASILAKGQSFYRGEAPTLNVNAGKPIYQSRQCPKCATTLHKSLAVCTQCGDGQLQHQPLPGLALGKAVRPTRDPGRELVQVGGPVRSLVFANDGQIKIREV